MSRVGIYTVCPSCRAGVHTFYLLCRAGVHTSCLLCKAGVHILCPLLNPLSGWAFPPSVLGVGRVVTPVFCVGWAFTPSALWLYLHLEAVIWAETPQLLASLPAQEMGRGRPVTLLFTNPWILPPSGTCWCQAWRRVCDGCLCPWQAWGRYWSLFTRPSSA